uniref:Plakophilin 3b n=1 Tax=Esox lucius TaxID=8010 RepID=A0A6Q2Z409_ESOLU
MSFNQEHVFMSALQPNTSVSTYAVPSDMNLGGIGGGMSDDFARAKRVQDQVALRLMEKSKSLPRPNSHYATSEPLCRSTSPTLPGRWRGSPNSDTHPISFGLIPESPPPAPLFLPNAHAPPPPPLQANRASQYSGGYSARSAVDLGGVQRVSMGVGRGGGGGGYQYQDDMRVGGGYHTIGGYQVPLARPAHLARSVSNLRLSAPQTGTLPTAPNRDIPFWRGELWPYPGRLHSYFCHGRAVRCVFKCVILIVVVLFLQVSSGSQGNLQQLNRSMSIRSMHSVGRGRDIYDGQNDMTGSMINVSGLDIPMAVMQLDEDDIAEQVQGAAYIQHECYNNNDAKNEVRICKGIQKLVRLFNSENLEVARYATGATRNLIYENLENKAALIEAGGIPQLIEALKYNDDELRKNITGILWNLSSKDNLKEKLAKETLADLTEKILIPLSGSGDSEVIQQSPSESDIFFNTTGCLRNLSSVNEKTRQKMRETSGLVDALVGYVKASLEDGKVEGKGVENTVCVLRNLSYQLYSEIPPSALLRLEGPSRDQDTSFSQAIGCFTPQSKKLKNKNQDMATFTEVARIPKGVEWLWHPQVVGLYNNVLQGCEINSTTREAAAGALQNITAGDKRWAGVLSRVALDQERMLPVLLDKLRTNNDMELRSLTGFLRNLSRHASDKSAMATKIVQNLVNKLPADGNQKEPSSDVVVNICGALNNLVASSSLAARDITFFDGLQKLVAIKDSHDSSPGKLKAAKAAATVLCNMFQYKKLHKNYKQVRNNHAKQTTGASSRYSCL